MGIEKIWFPTCYINIEYVGKYITLVSVNLFENATGAYIGYILIKILNDFYHKK